MNAKNRQLILVGVLFTVAGGAAYWQFYPSSSTVANAGTAPNAQVVPPAKRIDIDLIAGSESRGSVGRNPFLFFREVIVAPPPPPPEITLAPQPPVTPVIPTTRPPDPRPTTPTQTIAPAIPLQYKGYARDDDNRMVAFLETTGGGGAAAGHFNLREDETLLGRYRVNKITVDSVELEDMERAEGARKQTINIDTAIAVKR
jgi:hypothetical protein